MAKSAKKVGKRSKRVIMSVEPISGDIYISIDGGDREEITDDFLLCMRARRLWVKLNPEMCTGVDAKYKP